ncbi:unnamed protein product [marine sediment metagenome]|uniref:Uncharacterized protein n=1 Tax=marine sediment metagenome TaxID=412755 RepID=X1SNH2_9ZZZZ
MDKSDFNTKRGKRETIRPVLPRQAHRRYQNRYPGTGAEEDGNRKTGYERTLRYVRDVRHEVESVMHRIVTPSDLRDGEENPTCWGQ